MLQLKNQTPFKPAIAVLPNRDAIDTLYVLVRATFDLAANPRPRDTQPGPVLADEYFEEPATSSLKYASELHIEKPATDVAVIGHAWARGERQVAELPVSLEVAGRRKVAQVYGERVWVDARRMTSPIPFLKMPLRWERAFGGSHRFGPGETDLLAEERNPIGRGFRGKRPQSDAARAPLPNFEDPRAPLAAFGEARDPVGFGFVAPAWLPRRAFAGTYDAVWKRKRAPYLPVDFDPRFLSAVPSDQVFAGYLKGGEPIRLLGMHREGPLDLRLPVCPLRIDVKVAGAHQTPPVRLETVLIEPDEDRLSLTFRASMPCNRQVLKIEEIVVEQA